MAQCRIDYEHQKEYSITENNAVGATTSLTLRTLTTTTPTDLNAVWLAMNGSDAGADGAAGTGTQAAPVLTIGKAISVANAQPARNTIHIFRNGYVGDLIFTTATAKTLNAGMIIQSELGETPIISFNGTAYTQNWTCNGLTLNGLKIYINNTDTTNTFYPLYLVTATNNQTIKWCTIYDDGITNYIPIWIYDIAIAATRTVSISNSLFKYTSIGQQKACILVNNAGIKININITDSALYSNKLHYALRLQTYGQCGMIIDHCSFNGFDTIFMDDYSGVASFGQRTMIDTILHNYGLVEYTYRSDTMSSFNVNTSTSSYNLYGGMPSCYLPRSSIYVNITTTNGITYTSPLYFSDTDLRLMDERRKSPTSNQYFEFTSKAVYNSEIGQVPGDDTRDLGAYDVSYSLDSDTWLAFTFGNAEWTDPVQIEHEFVNYQAFQDIRGNYRRTFDAEKRRFQWSLPNDDYMTTSRAYEILDLLRSTTAKRFYPYGNDGLWASSGALAINADSNYDVTLSSISDLDRNAFIGYVCKCSSGVNDYYLQIASNSSGALVLRDHRGTQGTISNGTYNVRNLYLPIEFDHNSKAMDFIDYNPETNPLYPTYDPSWIEGYEAIGTNAEKTWVGAVRNLTFRETEEDE